MINDFFDVNTQFDGTTDSRRFYKLQAGLKDEE
jgi:hypothetical protein